MDEQFVHEDQMRNARTQGVGSMVSEQNRQNALELMQKMHKIDTQNAAAKARIENNLDKALQCVDNVRDFVGSPEHILGNPKTKHGEIAENVDVWFHNADQIMRNRKADATFEGVGRTVATDYKVHGVDVQSKYINGANNSLSHVLKHMEDYIGNYEAFGKDGYYVIHYNEDEVSRIFLGDEASLQIESSTVICHGDREKGFFIQSIENSKGLGTCTITNSTFVDNLDFIKGKFDILDFNNNLTQGLYYPLMDIKVKTSAKIRNSRFLSHTPSFAKKYSKSGLDRQDELLYLHNESDYDPAEILIDNDVFVGKEKFDFAHSEEQKEHRMIGKSEEQEELLAIKGPSSKLFRYNKDAMGTVSNCTFTNMGKCVSGMDTVTNCIFDGCSYAVDECCYKVKESRFYNCALACQKLFGQAVVSNCQFVNCKGEELITSGLNAEVKVEDCEFSNIRLVEDGFTYYFRSMIVFGTADSKFANAGRWSEVNRCIFNGICISRKSNRTPKSDEHAYVICAQVTSVDKFKFARARVADCTFTNCASVNSKLINTEPYDSLFGKKHNYMAVSSRNNSGLNDIGDPSSFVASSNVKLKETDANGNKIGSSLSVN